MIHLVDLCKFRINGLNIVNLRAHCRNVDSIRNHFFHLDSATFCDGLRITGRSLPRFDSDVDEDESFSSASIFFRWHRRFFRFFFSRFSKSISGVVGTSGVDSCFWSFFASSTLTMILGNRIGSLPVISCLSDFFFFNCFLVTTSDYFVWALDFISFLN